MNKFKYTWGLLIFLGILWSLIIFTAAYINYRGIEKTTYELALNEARATLNKDLSFRLWVTSHGGIYVHPDSTTPPNPYLSYIPNRDIITTTGEKLTMMNPAYVVRQVMEMHSRLYDVRGHITSLKPIRPENAPDPWEKKAMKSLETGAAEAVEISLIEDKPFLRFMQPLITQEGCLKCHAQQGYKKGDIRGGLGTSIPMDRYLRIERASLQKSVLSYITLWLIGIGSLVYGGNRLDRNLALQKEKEEDFENIFNMATDLVCIASYTHFIRVNPSFMKVLGYSEEELRKTPYIELIHPDDIKRTRDIIEKKISNGVPAVNFINRYRHKNGTYRWLEWMTNAMLSKDLIYAAARDITDRIKAEEQILLNKERMESLIKISQHRSENLKELLDYALEEAIRLTRSKIGYVCHYSEEKRELTLNSWSHGVMNECSVKNPPTVFSLDSTGLWGEVVRQRRPIVVNEYDAHNPLKKGFPDGHVRLDRFLTIPVINMDRIVLVVGVANKETDYDRSDINQLTLLMDTVWKLAEKKRAEDEIIRSLDEKNVLLKEVHHRVKNNMAIILSLLELQSSYAHDERLKSMFRDSTSRIKTMSLVHEKLYKSKNFASIETSEYISDLADEILTAYEVNKGEITLKLDIENNNITLDTLIPLGLIINEILMNSVKHAFGTHDAGAQISISLHAGEGGLGHLMVGDNGTGLPSDDFLSQKKTLGLQIINALVSQIEGTMKIDRTGGTTYHICFPMARDS